MSEHSTPVVKKVSKVKIRNMCKDLPDHGDQWRDEASCLGEDINLFVYSSDEPTDRLREQLTAICQSCKVIISCRKEGLRTLSEGWWGGMTPQERLNWAADQLFANDL